MRPSVISGSSPPVPKWLSQSLLALATSTSLLFGDPGAALAGGGSVSLNTPLSALQQQEQTVGDLFERATPSVVQVTQFSSRTNPYTMNEVEVPTGTGSGFIWDEAGHVVTNFHVIRGAAAAKVSVIDPSGKTSSYNAKLVGYNPDKDVAVLEIGSGAARGLRPIELGASAGLRVGQTTLAIGNPFGLDHTLTVGVVSGVGREMTAPSGRTITNVIQTDAAINPGNSGGALLDSRGRLIGMNTAIYSPSGTSAGIGFAVPVDTLKTQVDAILARAGRGGGGDGGANAARPVLGISYVVVGEAPVIERASVAGKLPRGILVIGVSPSAERAGLRGTVRLGSGAIRLGDLIVGIDGVSVGDEDELLAALDTHRAGETVRLDVVHLGDASFGDPATAPRVQLPIQLADARS